MEEGKLWESLFIVDNEESPDWKGPTKEELIGLCVKGKLVSSPIKLKVVGLTEPEKLRLAGSEEEAKELEEKMAKAADIVPEPEPEPEPPPPSTPWKEGANRPKPKPKPKPESGGGYSKKIKNYVKMRDKYPILNKEMYLEYKDRKKNTRKKNTRKKNIRRKNTRKKNTRKKNTRKKNTRNKNTRKKNTRKKNTT